MGSFITGLCLILTIIFLISTIVGPIWLFVNKYKKYGFISIPIGIILTILCFILSSLRYVGNEVGIPIKNAFGPSLSQGSMIALNGEMGPQADILRSGWHFGYWPWVFNVEYTQYINIKPNEVGIITALDGQLLPEGYAYAPEWDEDQFQNMLDARYFLSNNGYRGLQSSVLRPGRYAINTKLFQIDIVQANSIPASSVGVVKSNAGPPSPTNSTLVNVGERGIWNKAFSPQLLYINPHAYELITVSTIQHVADYSGGPEYEPGDGYEEYLEREIDVKTQDGFEFPIDVRVIYYIKPENAPLAVSNFYDEKTKSIHERLRSILNSCVRSEFRNNAERTTAMQYINSRSNQEQQSLQKISADMEVYGVTVISVAIGGIDPDRTSQQLAALLKTQTDREIANRQVETLRQETLAAQEREKLNIAEQSAESAILLTQAEFDRQVALQQMESRISLAKADAERIRLEQSAMADGILAQGTARAESYRLQAEALGSTNLAYMEIVERLQTVQPGTITPRITVGQGGSIWDLLGVFFSENYENTGQLPFTDRINP